jgi:hypothetical protein
MHAPKTDGALGELTGGTLGTSHSSMFLTFNENVLAGESTMAIKSFDYSTSAPVMSGSGTVINDKYATVTLSFNQKVQKGAGTVALHKAADDAVLGTAVAVASVNYAGSKAIFKPSTSLATGISYYIKGSAAGAIKGAGGTAMAAAINTKSTFYGVKEQALAGTRKVSVMYNSLEEYACMPNGGALPDATLYFNTDVTITTDSYINRTTGGWALPGVICNPDATNRHVMSVCSFK